MAKISPADQAQACIRQRDVDDALRELDNALIVVSSTMQVLAAKFPGVTLVTAIDSGEPCGPLAYAQWREGARFNSTAMRSGLRLRKPNEEVGR
jgi:hypothetical protein